MAKKSDQGRVILIGDAAHTMTMCKGEGEFIRTAGISINEHIEMTLYTMYTVGGNHALQDAAELGPLLADVYEAGKPLAEAVQVYHDSMIPRAQKAGKESHDACFFMHRPKREVKQMFINLACRQK